MHTGQRTQVANDPLSLDLGRSGKLLSFSDRRRFPACVEEHTIRKAVVQVSYKFCQLTGHVRQYLKSLNLANAAKSSVGL